MGKLIIEGLRVRLYEDGFNVTRTTEGRASRVMVGDVGFLPPDGDEDFDFILSDIAASSQRTTKPLVRSCEICGEPLDDAEHHNRFPCEVCGKVVCDGCGIDLVTGEGPDRVLCRPCADD